MKVHSWNRPITNIARGNETKTTTGWMSVPWQSHYFLQVFKEKLKWWVELYWKAVQVITGSRREVLMSWDSAADCLWCTVLLFGGKRRHLTSSCWFGKPVRMKIGSVSMTTKWLLNNGPVYFYQCLLWAPLKRWYLQSHLSHYICRVPWGKYNTCLDLFRIASNSV